MALTELAAKWAGIDVLRQMVRFMARRLMEIDTRGHRGAGCGQKAPSARIKTTTATAGASGRGTRASAASNAPEPARSQAGDVSGAFA